MSYWPRERDPFDYEHNRLVNERLARQNEGVLRLILDDYTESYPGRGYYRGDELVNFVSQRYHHQVGGRNTYVVNPRRVDPSPVDVREQNRRNRARQQVAPSPRWFNPYESRPDYNQLEMDFSRR